MITIWLIILLLGAVSWLIYQFNTLVGLSNHADAAWAQIDSQLARRYELVTRLLDLVKTSPAATGPALEHLAAARTAAMNAYTPAEKSQVEPPLAAGITTVLALAHSLPQLTTNEELLQLQHTLADIEDYLNGARRVYNALVQDLNARSTSVPNRFLASLFGVEPRELYQPAQT